MKRVKVCVNGIMRYTEVSEIMARCRKNNIPVVFIVPWTKRTGHATYYGSGCYPRLSVVSHKIGYNINRSFFLMIREEDEPLVRLML